MFKKCFLVMIAVLLVAAAARPERQAYSSLGLSASAGNILSNPGETNLSWHIETSDSSKIDLWGESSLAKFQQVLYQDLATKLGIPGGPVDLRLNAKFSPGQTVLVILESNYSTGYRWLLADDQSAAFRQLGDSILPQADPLSDGQPQKQELVLAAAVDSDHLALVYRRSWEPAQAAINITLQFAELPAQIDLSNPFLEPANQPQPVLVAPGPENPAGTETLPAAFDWRTINKVTPVRDQGQCGSCCAFGTVGVMVSAMLIAGDGSPATLNLSEQYLVSCNTYGFNCEHGGNYDAHDFHYITNGLHNNPPGAVLESAFPYTATDGSCTQVYNHPYRLASWHYLNPGYPPVIPTPDAIKQAIYTYGPVGVSVCAGNAFLDYQGGIFATDESSQCTYSNHAVVLVGWDNNGGNGYWILKNSWNTWWGESGYMRIRWGTSRIGIFANYVNYTSANNPVPVITQIIPAVAFKGGAGFTLNVTGSGFVNSSKVRWNGADRATTFVNSGKLTASIPASDIVNSGSANITVYSPAPGGGVSNNLVLEIVDPATLNKKIHLPTILKK